MQEDDGSEDLSLQELFALIKTKSENISKAVEELEALIGEVEE